MRMDRLCGAIGTFCLFATGCFSYGPYGQPGPYGGVSHTAMGPQTMIGGAPPGTVWVPASPNTAGNVTLGPAGVVAPEPLRRANPANAVSKDQFEEPATGKVVPDPVDHDKNKPAETEPFGYSEETQVERRGTKTTQRTRPLRLDADRDTFSSAAESEPELAEPDDSVPNRPGLQTADFKTRVRADGVQPASAESDDADKFDYDAESYTWLKGVVEFDRADKSWHLTYAPSPSDADQFGGEVTFKNNYDFKKLVHNGQVILVKGRFDPDQTDRLGKPVYEVESVSRIGK